MSNTLVSIVVLLLSSSVFASDLGGPLTVNSRSKYRELQAHYRSSALPAEIQNFDRIEDVNSRQQCTTVVEEDPDSFISVKVRALTLEETKIVIYGVGSIDGMYGVYDYVKMSSTESDLISSMSDTDEYRESPHDLFLRQGENYIFFKFVQYKAGDGGPAFPRELMTAYGYCWTE